MSKVVGGSQSDHRSLGPLGKASWRRLPHNGMDRKGIPGREPGCMGSGQEPHLQELLNGLLVPRAIYQKRALKQKLRGSSY